MHASKHIFKRFEKGVSFIEVMVAMFIFTVMITSMMSVFLTLLHKRSEARDAQQQTEEFSLAMSYMSKKIRTSSLAAAADCDTSSCKVHDNNTDADVTFSFSGGDLTETTGTGLVSIVSGVSGGFVATNADTGKIPRIMMSIMATGKPETAVQTTVSLRSY